MDIDDDFDDILIEWDRNRRVASILISYLVLRLRHSREHNVARVIRTSEEMRQRDVTRNDLLHKIRTDPTSYDVIRMKPEAFATFCDILQTLGKLSDTRRASVEEQVAKFLYILGHDVKNRAVSFFFNRSLETTSRHFHRVLRAIISLEDHFLKQPDGDNVPPEIQNSFRFFPYFKDCIGALDDTHIRVKTSSSVAPRYRGRKDHPTQNVLAACSFDLKFMYVLPGWEGTASDSRIIKNALTREDNLEIPQGKYYLVDGGYMLTSSLLPPYRGVRYHLREYSRRGPENARELFNIRHSSLRVAIERSFGVLKKRFSITGHSESTYTINTQNEIILACCILHNFLMGVDPDEKILAEVDREIQAQQTRHPHRREIEDVDNEDARRGAIIRDNIALSMWNDYIL